MDEYHIISYGLWCNVYYGENHCPVWSPKCAAITGVGVDMSPTAL